MTHSHAGQIPTPVNFHGHQLFVIEHNGEPFTPMKPLVEAMGLGWQAQYDKLKTNAERWGIREILIPSKGGPQKSTCAPIRKLPGFLQTIHPNKVNPKIRERVVLFQNECDDALWAYWNEGRAVNPRATPPSIPTQEEYEKYSEGDWPFVGELPHHDDPNFSRMALEAIPYAALKLADRWRLYYMKKLEEELLRSQTMRLTAEMLKEPLMELATTCHKVDQESYMAGLEESQLVLGLGMIKNRAARPTTRPASAVVATGR